MGDPRACDCGVALAPGEADECTDCELDRLHAEISDLRGQRDAAEARATDIHRREAEGWSQERGEAAVESLRSDLADLRRRLHEVEAERDAARKRGDMILAERDDMEAAWDERDAQAVTWKRLARRLRERWQAHFATGTPCPYCEAATEGAQCPRCYGSGTISPDGCDERTADTASKYRRALEQIVDHFAVTVQIEEIARAALSEADSDPVDVAESIRPSSQPDEDCSGTGKRPLSPEAPQIEFTLHKGEGELIAMMAATIAAGVLAGRHFVQGDTTEGYAISMAERIIAEVERRAKEAQ